MGKGLELQCILSQWRAAILILYGHYTESQVSTTCCSKGTRMSYSYLITSEMNGDHQRKPGDKNASFRKKIYRLLPFSCAPFIEG
jgi:hypothetical protein